MDPFPIKHSAVLLAHVRDRLEPLLRERGFEFAERNNPRGRAPILRWIDYTRDSTIFTLQWHQHIASLLADMADAEGNVRRIAACPFEGTQSHEDLLARAAAFIKTVGDYLQSIPAVKAI